MISTLENPEVKFDKSIQQRVTNAIVQLQNKKGIILTDNSNRENEGDLIFSAQHMTVQDMALMIRECSGIVCLCLTNEKADQLELPYMVQENSSQFQTPFSVTIEAKKGVTTGVSASDRLTTIKAASATNALASDLARPGHIFPLRAKNNGVLERDGHTEGSIDLMKLANLEPQAVLCELMNPDGSMANTQDIKDFAEKHDLVILSIADLIHYRKFVTDYI